MKNFLILPIVFYFLNIHPAPEPETGFLDLNSDTLTIYLVKQRWHTGIVFSVADIDTMQWSEIKDFQNFKYVDVGWGDEEFYQYPDFDAGLAVKALFYPTASTIRVEGFNFDIERYVEMSDIAAQMIVTQSQLKILCRYISETYFKNDSGKKIILDERYGGNIKFYKANGNYHLFNTCNTWVARGLEKAGFEINPAEIILAGDLFHAIDDFGIILKTEKVNGVLE